MRHVIIFIAITILSCDSKIDLKEVSKQEILQAEKAFANMANDVGIREAFIEYADESAVLNRNDKIISGLDSIKAHFSSPTPEGTTLQWSPDFVEASESGDLGYTYGKFVYTRLDSTGNPEEITGIFHTVWKKQDDGSWKYVYD